MKTLMTLLLVLLLNTAWADEDSAAAAMLFGITSQPDRFANDNYDQERERPDRYNQERSDERYTQERYSAQEPEQKLSPEMTQYYRCLDSYYETKGKYLTLKAAYDYAKEWEDTKDEGYNAGIRDGGITAGLGGISMGVGGIINHNNGSTYARDAFAAGGLVALIIGGVQVVGNLMAKGSNDETYSIAYLGLYDMTVSDLKKELKKYEDKNIIPEECRKNASWDFEDLTNEADYCAPKEIETDLYVIICENPEGLNCKECY